MKNRYAYIVTALICCLLFFTNVKAQVLLVPEIEQEQNQWCWAGVSKCVLDYYGFSHQQCDIAEYARLQNTSTFGNNNCCANPTGSCNNPNSMFSSTSGGIDDILSNFGSITTTNIYAALPETQWQTEISNGVPVIIRYGLTGGGGHFVVGYGVQGSDYYTMDPWFNEGYTISTYNWVVTGQGGGGSWTHTQTLSPPLPTLIEEHTTNKELLKIVDILGRETKGTKNEVLFYIYDDGTVEKRIVIE
jgi:hypothetical protein